MALAYVDAALIPDATESTSKGFTLPTVLSAPGEITLFSSPTGGPVTGVITMLPISVVAEEVPGLSFTIPWGRVIQAAAMLGIMLIMMSIGSAQYEVWGTPYDYAYLEKMSIAMEDGLDYWRENEKEIKNDFVGTHDQANTIAVTELVWEKSLTRTRRIVIEDDPSLEVGDIVGIPDGRKILITGLSKKIKRGEVPSLVIDGCKVMTP